MPLEIANFLPPDLPVWGAILILISSFLASAITAALAIGGGLLLISVMTTLMPAAAVVPVHGLIMIGSNAGRAALLTRYVLWRRLAFYAGGALVGAYLASQVVMTLPPAALRFSIAAFIFFTQWGPKISLPTGDRAFTLTGTVSTFLSVFVGASGPFITALLSKIPNLDRRALVASGGACMTVQHGLKVIVFGFLGFSFAPWLPLIIASVIVGFAGTVVGNKLLNRLPEAQFRQGLKYVLTGFAVYLTGLGAWGLLGL